MASRVIRFATAAVLAAIGSIGVASVAEAPTVCPAGYMCGWGDRYYKTSGSTAARVLAYQCQNDLSNNNYAGTTRNANNDITSVYNNGNTSNGYYYTSTWYAGSSLYVPRGSGFQELNASHPTMNDSITSFKFTSAPGTCV